MDDTQPLIGNVTSQFLLSDIANMQKQIELTRAEQEAMCGYPLKVQGVRTTESIDDKNRRVIEVFATFAPAEQS